jgi:hypothetical protein
MRMTPRVWRWLRRRSALALLAVIVCGLIAGGLARAVGSGAIALLALAGAMAVGELLAAAVISVMLASGLPGSMGGRAGPA